MEIIYIESWIRGHNEGRARPHPAREDHGRHRQNGAVDQRNLQNRIHAGHACPLLPKPRVHLHRKAKTPQGHHLLPPEHAVRTGLEASPVGTLLHQLAV